MKTAVYEEQTVTVLAVYPEMNLPAFPPGDYAWIEDTACSRFFVPLAELTDITEG